jgi:hypothetical protein
MSTLCKSQGLLRKVHVASQGYVRSSLIFAQNEMHSQPRKYSLRGVEMIQATRSAAAISLQHRSALKHNTRSITPRGVRFRQFWGIFSSTPGSAGPVDPIEGHSSTDLYWSELDGHTRRAWEVLGWTQRSWDDIDGVGGAPPHSVHKSWHELGAMELKAAQNLGYDKKTWNADESYQDKLE